MKKHLVLILAILLTVSAVLASCGASPTPAAPTVSASASSEETTPETTPAATPEESATPEVMEPVTVKIWAPGNGGTVKDWSEDAILNQVEEKTNTKIEMTWIDWGAYNDQLSAASASNGFPDMVCAVDHMAKTMLQGWVDGNTIAAFEGPVAEAAPNVLAQYASDPSLNELKFAGKIYLQPVGWGTGNAPNMGLIHVRKDLLDKFGMQTPDTWAQYVDYLRKCVKDEKISGVVLSGKGGFSAANLNTILGGYGLPMTGWVKINSGYEFWAVQPQVADALVTFRQLFAEKLVDLGVWDMDGDTARTTYVSGKSGSFIFNGGGHIGRMQNDMTLVDKAYVESLLPALDMGTGKRGYTQEPMYWGASMVGGGPDNQPVAAAKIINYLISEEGYQLTAIGIEGRDYKKNGDAFEWLDQRFADGFPTEANDAGAHPLASAIVSWQPQKWQDFTLLYGKDTVFADWYRSMQANQVKYQVPSFGSAVTTPKWTEFQATGGDILSRALTTAVLAKSDEETRKIWTDAIAEWKTAGGDASSEEMSNQLMSFYK